VKMALALYGFKIASRLYGRRASSSVEPCRVVNSDSTPACTHLCDSCIKNETW